jgi:hypothetical protein
MPASQPAASMSTKLSSAINSGIRRGRGTLYVRQRFERAQQRVSPSFLCGVVRRPMRVHGVPPRSSTPAPIVGTSSTNSLTVVPTPSLGLTVARGGHSRKGTFGDPAGNRQLRRSPGPVEVVRAFRGASRTTGSIRMRQASNACARRSGIDHWVASAVNCANRDGVASCGVLPQSRALRCRSRKGAYSS